MKIALIGYGKMGREIERIALSRGHEIVCIIDRDNRADFASPAFASAEVAIEFTSPDAAFDNVREAFAHGVKVVSGTTAWLPQHEEEINEMCAGGATLLWSSNFSLGVAIFAAVNKYLASIMDRYANYDVSMTEVHHIHKLDAPSGTTVTYESEADKITITHEAKNRSGFALGAVLAAEYAARHTGRLSVDDLFDF